MFGVILDRFLALTLEAISQKNAAPKDRLSMDIFPEDAKIIFPAIKVICSDSVCPYIKWTSVI